VLLKRKESMKLHWSLSNLIVLITACAMLGMTQFAMAGFHEPWRLPPGCPPECSDPPTDHTWQFAVVSHVTVANTAYQNGGVVSPAVLLEAADRMNKYATEIIDNGTYNTVAKVIEQVLISGKWSTVSLKALAGFDALNNFGNALPLATMQAMLNAVSPANRASAAWNIQTYGLWASFYEAAAILTQFANAEAHRIPGQALRLGPVKIPPGWARVVFDTLEVAGTILLISDPIGWVVLIGGYAGNQYMNANGM
jgi:hypothetical protein